MQRPRVSFVVPCYRLGHLLAECAESILSQTFRDFELIIMDDCSPDGTPAVAATLKDSRVRYVRNGVNIGHLNNYNKGIGLASGDLVWLISADDRLRAPHALERYVSVMDANAHVGYAISRAIWLEGMVEGGIVEWASLGDSDEVIDGRAFLGRLLSANCVVAASGMVRKECYDRLGTFPLDLPFAGDWYLWCLFALAYDVAYFAEPMVNYRRHSDCMTDALIAERLHTLSRDGIEVRWRMKEQIERRGVDGLAARSRDAIADEYVQNLCGKKWRHASYRMNLQEFEQSLLEHCDDAAERVEIRRMVLAAVGRNLYLDKRGGDDWDLYRLAVFRDPTNARLWAKFAIVSLGPIGRIATAIRRATLSRSRRRLHVEP